LKELLTYSPETGLFCWKVRTSNRIRVGDVAGCHETHYGYVLIGIDGVIYGAHQLAWLFVHGEWHEIDHENLDRGDNRINNLRKCSRSQNQFNRGKQENNTSGFKGVSYHSQSGKWVARLSAGGKRKSLGLHDTPESAHQAYCAGAKLHHGEFARFQ
jgi:hypothetical protein